RRAAIAASERGGGGHPEGGVGTRISLPYYFQRSPGFGIDLFPHMLQEARRRGAGRGVNPRQRPAVMGAARLDFPDGSFDVVVAQYVVNTVPHPEIALNEFARVLKPGGEIVLLNRVGADAGPRRLFEHLFQPVANKLGWRSEFPWERFAQWVES